MKFVIGIIIDNVWYSYLEDLQLYGDYRYVYYNFKWGDIQNFRAEQGLLVSWGGIKSSVDNEVPSKFFCERLWD